MIENTWFNEEKTIILQSLSGQWRWEEVMDSNQTDIPRLMDEVQHTVHMIVSLEDSPSLPSGSALLKGKDATTSLPKNLGLLVIVSPDKYVRVLIDMVSKIAVINDERKLKSAQTLDEAQDIIRQYAKTAI